MQFGNWCSALLETRESGTFYTASLPEFIPCGAPNALIMLEHVVMRAEGFDPEKPVTLHVLQEDLERDLFAISAKRKGVLKQALNGLKNENGLLIVQRGIDKEQRALFDYSVMGVANRKDLVAHVLKHLNVSRVFQEYDYLASKDVEIARHKAINNDWGSFSLQAFARVEAMRMPEAAWKFLCPEMPHGENTPRIFVPRRHWAITAEPKAQGEDFPLVRVHSSCFTGDLCGSVRCDCGQQLEKAMGMIAKRGGAILYHDAEGRGIGLSLKLLMYEMMRNRREINTYNAMTVFGFEHDERKYEGPAEILKGLGLNRIVLATNNPEKKQALVDAGIDIIRCEPLVTMQNHEPVRRYLRDKASHGHTGLVGFGS